ncbi:MAG TPA: extracellular solute-binding protein [Candidatus Limnocylindria bacterium]|nr:extracellular solute-binding protein [Candidatus Limnocylindria bacterium]
MSHGNWRKVLVLVGALAVVGAGCNTGETGKDKEVTVIGSWGDAEQDSFLAMVEPWETRTGNTVKYTGSRGLGAYLTTAVASGTLPDLAGLPGPGEMVQFAASGALKPLDDVLDMDTYRADTVPALVELGSSGGNVVGVFMKLSVKGFIWYNTANYTGERPANWDAVMAVDPSPADSLFCVALESAADSGWPGTDWIEDFVIRQSGPQVYDSWVAGTTKWTDPAIKQAFEAFGEVLEVSFGGAAYQNSTYFGDGGNELFSDPPGCKFHHQASFMSSFFKESGGAADGDYDFFVMPEINSEYAGALTGGGDLLGLFSDKAAAKDLLKYLVSAEAQQIWADRGGFVSANTKVTTYPNPVEQKSADAIHNATVFRFDGGDLMPGTMKAAFFTAMVDFAENPGNLDQILAELDTIQSTAYTPQ